MNYEASYNAVSLSSLFEYKFAPEHSIFQHNQSKFLPTASY